MAGAKRYLDVNVFVYWLGGHPEFGEAAREWITRVESAPPGRYVTSVLAVYETLVIVAGLTGRSLEDAKFVRDILGAVGSLASLAVESLTADDLERASRLMEDYGLDYEDALHLAIALRVGAGEMVSSDRDFDGTPLKRVF